VRRSFRARRDLKKGERTVGVQRQYTGTAGRIENATVTVFAAWATPEQRFLVDYELYLPESWTADPERMATAGVPGSVGFATKLVQAKQILSTVPKVFRSLMPWNIRGARGR
jgi:SRSO17 transposase